MTEFVANADTTDAADAASMPFTKFVTESEAAYQHDHPEAKTTPFAETDMGKVILEQESKVAADHASGRISDDDYNAFRELSESRVDSLKTHLREIGEEFGDGIDSWKHDAVATFEEFKTDHAEALADLQSGNPSIGHMAEGAEMVVEVMDPLIDPVVDTTHDVLDAMRDELGDTAQQMVEARAEQQGVDANEVEASRIKVEVARETLDAEIDKAHDAVDAFRDRTHDEGEAMVNALHDYAETHPDSQLNDVSPAAITDPHIQETIQEETGIAEV